METQTLSRSGYAPVNGLQMYYELHNERGAGTPLVLLHGAFSGIGTSHVGVSTRKDLLLAMISPFLGAGEA